MPIVGAELLKLDRLVTSEVSRLRNKFSFWGVNPAVDISLPEPESENYQNMIRTLQSISDIDRLSGEQQALVGIGWEFVWGASPPKEVIDLRDNMLAKAGSGEHLSEQEQLWLQIIAVDTDSF